jgi:hypothetical protein
MFLDGDGGELVEEDADQARVGSVEVVARRARGQAEQELAEERRHRHGAAVERQAGGSVGLDEDAVRSPARRRRCCASSAGSWARSRASPAG